MRNIAHPPNSDTGLRIQGTNAAFFIGLWETKMRSRFFMFTDFLDYIGCPSASTALDIHVTFS